MKIFVAGGAGYVGSRLVPLLLSHGYEVTVLDLLWFGNALPDSVEVIQKDIQDIDATNLAGYDQIIFLAGLSNDPMAEFSPAMNFVSNAAAPAYLAFIAKQAGVRRFIYADSCSVYGYTVDELYDEKGPTTCNYPYGISKLQGEFGVMQLEDSDFSVICLRKGTISGYSPRMRFDLIINMMYMSAMTKKVITVNNPTIWRPILGIKDAMSGYIRAIQASEDINGVFNLASGNFTVGQVADLVWEHVNRVHDLNVKLEIKDIQDFRNYKVSNQKAHDILGVSFNDSIETILSELDNYFGPDFDYSKNNFYNIRIFKQLFSKLA